MIKLYKDFDDFKWEEETNEVIEELNLDPVPVGTLDLRNGHEVRVVDEDEDGGYMVVVFDGVDIVDYKICDTKEEINKYLIELQKRKM